MTSTDHRARPSCRAFVLSGQNLGMTEYTMGKFCANTSGLIDTTAPEWAHAPYVVLADTGVIDEAERIARAAVTRSEDSE